MTSDNKNTVSFSLKSGENPIADAVISINDLTGHTDDKGNCIFENVSPGEYDISVSAGIFDEYRDSITILDNDNNFNINLGQNSYIEKRPFEAYQGKEPYVFVSYAHNDAQVVFNELKRFNDIGIKIWYDEGFSTDSEWRDAVGDTVCKSSLHIVFITPNSVESLNVREEIFLSLGEKIPMIPIFLERTELKYGLRMHLAFTPSILKYEMPEDLYIKQCITTFRQYGFEVWPSNDLMILKGNLI